MIFRRDDPKLRTVEAIPLFSGLPSRDLRLVTSTMDICRVEPGSTLVTAGDFDRQFVVVIDGGAVMHGANGHRERLQRGCFFGEQEIIYDRRHTATVTAEGPLTVGVMDGRTFRSLLRGIPSLEQRLLSDGCIEVDEPDVTQPERAVTPMTESPASAG